MIHETLDPHKHRTHQAYPKGMLHNKQPQGVLFYLLKTTTSKQTLRSSSACLITLFQSE